MSNISILEHMRGLHGDIERAEKEIIHQLLRPLTHPRQQVIQHHFIAEKTRHIQQLSKTLVTLYASSEELAECVAIYNKLQNSDTTAGESSRITNEAITTFQQRVTQIRDHYRGTGRNRDVEIEEPIDVPSPNYPRVRFSGEENWGVCVDVLEFYREYVNLTGRSDVSYRDYLKGGMTSFADVQGEVRGSISYKSYIKRLVDYFRDLFRRCNPTDDAVLSAEPNSEDMEVHVKYWVDVHAQRFQDTDQRILYKQTTSWEELEAEERREHEAMLEAFEKAEHEDPKAAEKDERQADVDPEEAKLAAAAVPKNAILGWDGKPIPTWLSKLHGLTVPYPCEICNMTYYGPQVYERHFVESRHTHYLGKLGIANSRHFNGVSTEAEAKALWNRICSEVGQGVWRPDSEEIEDAEGTVVTRRTYDEMRRHGLVR